MSDSQAWPLPPHVQYRDFLPADDHDALIRWVLDNRSRFSPATIINRSGGAKYRENPDVRIALTTRDLNPLRPMLEQKFGAALEDVERATGVRAGRSIELEIAAHPDGAFYLPHVDTAVGEGRWPVGAAKGEDRVISSVYYFHREPKAFSGGNLRLFRFNVRPNSGPAKDNDYVELEPLQNSFVAFPSWATHEVRPIHCPGDQFENYRFAINCWFCRKV